MEKNRQVLVFNAQNVNMILSTTRKRPRVVGVASIGPPTVTVPRSPLHVFRRTDHGLSVYPSRFTCPLLGPKPAANHCRETVCHLASNEGVLAVEPAPFEPRQPYSVVGSRVNFSFFQRKPSGVNFC